MASSFDNELLIATHEADQGCFEHFRCFCAIREDFEALKARLGPNFETWWDYFCRACAITPTVPTRPNPNPPLRDPDPPVLQPDPETPVVPRSCSLPDPRRY